jgi:hypothetical protein
MIPRRHSCGSEGNALAAGDRAPWRSSILEKSLRRMPAARHSTAVPRAGSFPLRRWPRNSRVCSRRTRHAGAAQPRVRAPADFANPSSIGVFFTLAAVCKWHARWLPAPPALRASPVPIRRAPGSTPSKRDDDAPLDDVSVRSSAKGFSEVPVKTPHAHSGHCGEGTDCMAGRSPLVQQLSARTEVTKVVSALRPARAASMYSIKRPSLKGFVRNPIAPASSARVRVLSSGKAVTKVIGVRLLFGIRWL